MEYWSIEKQKMQGVSSLPLHFYVYHLLIENHLALLWPSIPCSSCSMYQICLSDAD
jgi:hypothetical protein